MTRAQLTTLMLSWLNDANAGFFISANTNTWLNLAHRQVQMELLQAGHNWYMRPVETLTIAQQADYILPSDFMVEHRIEIVLSGTGVSENRQALVPITTNQQDLVAISSGIPTNYYIKKDRITLSPTPDNVYTMRLYYSPMVADLGSDSDVPDVPEQFMEYVALVAAYNGFVQDDRMPANLAAKMAEFKALLKEMAVDRTQDLARQVVEVQEYDAGFGWY